MQRCSIRLVLPGADQMGERAAPAAFPHVSVFKQAAIVRRDG
jgi:hypothetical protein